MTLIASLRGAIEGARDCVRKLGHLYVIGGPVGVLYTLKLARNKRHQARLAEYIRRERELNRANLAALNHELTQLIDQQQRTSQAAAEFWSWCEKKAGVRP